MDDLNIMEMFSWINENREWLFSGFGITATSLVTLSLVQVIPRLYTGIKIRRRRHCLEGERPTFTDGEAAGPEATELSGVQVAQPVARTPPGLIRPSISERYSYGGDRALLDAMGGAHHRPSSMGNQKMSAKRPGSQRRGSPIIAVTSYLLFLIAFGNLIYMFGRWFLGY